MPKQLKFRLTVTIDESGVLSAAELRVRDGDTRESTSLGGWPIPAPGASLDRLLDAIRREVALARARQAAERQPDTTTDATEF